MKTNICTWTEDYDGNWHTTCDERHIFIEGTPIENYYCFCPYCGKKIVEKVVNNEETKPKTTTNQPLILDDQRR